MTTQPNLPEPGSQNSTGRPTFQKQRSISELLSFTEPGPPPKPITPVEDKPMYNPYAPKPGSQNQQPMTMQSSGQAARVLPPVTKVPVVPKVQNKLYAPSPSAAPIPATPSMPSQGGPPPPPPPPPPCAEDEQLGFKIGHKAVSGKVGSAHASLQREKEEKLMAEEEEKQRQRQLEEERQRKLEEERRREEEMERQKKIEEENQRRMAEERERQRKQEEENQRRNEEMQRQKKMEEEQRNQFDYDMPDPEQLLREQQEFIRRQRLDSERMEAERLKSQVSQESSHDEQLDLRNSEMARAQIEMEERQKWEKQKQKEEEERRMKMELEQKRQMEEEQRRIQMEQRQREEEQRKMQMEQMKREEEQRRMQMEQRQREEEQRRMQMEQEKRRQMELEQKRQREEQERQIQMQKEQERMIYENNQRQMHEQNERKRREEERDRLLRIQSEEAERQRKMREEANARELQKLQRQDSKEGKKRMIKITIKAETPEPNENGNKSSAADAVILNGTDTVDLSQNIMDSNELQQEEFGVSQLKLNPKDVYNDALRAKLNRKAIDDAMVRQRASLSPQPMPTQPSINNQNPNKPNIAPNKPPHPPHSKREQPQQVYEVPIQRISSPTDLKPHRHIPVNKQPDIHIWNKPSPMQWDTYSTLPPRMHQTVPASPTSSNGHTMLRRVAQTPPPIRSIPVQPVHRGAATPPPNLFAQQEHAKEIKNNPFFVEPINVNRKILNHFFT